jgi:hypothetical protein
MDVKGKEAKTVSEVILSIWTTISLPTFAALMKAYPTVYATSSLWKEE